MMGLITPRRTGTEPSVRSAIRQRSDWVPAKSRVLGAALLCSALAAGPALAAAASDEPELAAIVVTAQRYKSTVQDTPFSISAVSGEQLGDAGIASVEELMLQVPGFSMRSAGPGQTEYEARGLASNGGSSPTVGYYLDEVPLSPPAASQTGKIVIDPNLYDLNRVELLRGPQGTVYGSGSMGGTVKLITNQPTLNAFEGSVQGILSDTEGGGLNGGVNAMLNMPLGATAALRVVVHDSYRSGWIDRVLLNPFPLQSLINGKRGDILGAPVESVDHDANTEKLYGGRASLLFQPSDGLSIVAMALWQRMKMGAYDEFDVPPGPETVARYQAFPIPEPVTDNTHVYSLTITANLGFADLTSASGYFDRSEYQTQDASENFSWALAQPAYIAVPYPEIDLSNQFSQELRLTSHNQEHDSLRWVVGAFYSDLHSDWIEYATNPAVIPLSSPPSDNPLGIIFNGDNKYKMRQYALFADGTYSLSDTFKASAGLRWYRYDSSQFQYPYIAGQAWGFYAPSLLYPATAPGTKASDSGYNPRFNLSYIPNAALTTYVSAAKGYRPGGANQVTASFCGPAPTSYGPDSVWNYEIGEKANIGNRFTINSDIYYIKWADVQQTLLLACGYQYTANAGEGRSYGPELEINAKLSPEWSIALGGTYTDAKINHPTMQFATQVVGGFSSCPTVSNCSVPILNVPKSTGSATLTYTTTVLHDYQLAARLTDSYVGSSYDAAYSFVQLPPYNLMNATLSLSSPKWTGRLFVTNLTNKVAEISANNTSFQVNLPGVIRMSTNQPRTFGTELNYRF